MSESVIKFYFNCPAGTPLYLIKRLVRKKYGAGDNDKVSGINKCVFSSRDMSGPRYRVEKVHIPPGHLLQKRYN